MRMVFLLITFMLFNKKSVDGMVINEGLQHLDQFFSKSHQNKHRSLSSNNYFFVTSTSDQHLLDDKYFSSTATDSQEILLQGK